MFSKKCFKLKSDARKILAATNELYCHSISKEEEKSIQFMWSKTLGANSVVLISRFQKQNLHLGFRIATSITEIGFQHQVLEVVENSDLDNNTQLGINDIILEVNGVNLLLLNYSELTILLGYLPSSIQLVYMKTDRPYENANGFDDKLSNVKTSANSWAFPVNIIVQGSGKKPTGLEFINNTSSFLNHSHCVIRKIDLNGTWFEDKRISVNDSILKINNTEVYNFQVKQMCKFFQMNKSCVYSLIIAKYKTNILEPNLDYTEADQSRLSLTNNIYKMSRASRRKYKPRALNPSPQCLNGLSNESKENLESHIMCINIKKTDDLGIYLVDIKDSHMGKSIICGINNNSKLKHKFRLGDHIIQINDDNVENFSSLAIGKLLQKYHSQSDLMNVTISRGPQPYRSMDSIIIPQESVCLNSDSPFGKTDCNSFQSSRESIENQEVITVTIMKMNDSFGLSIQCFDGPTITKVNTDFEIHKKEILKPGDKLLRINDIYVFNKQHDFVVTLLRSCGQSINLEILRSHDPQERKVLCVTNSNYKAESDSEICTYTHFEKS